MDTIIKNKQLIKALADEGLSWIDLVKGDGYFYISPNQTATKDQLDIFNGISSTMIYIYAFNHQSIEGWIEDIKNLLK